MRHSINSEATNYTNWEHISKRMLIACGNYIQLTKPRVLWLVVFSALIPGLIACLLEFGDYEKLLPAVLAVGFLSAGATALNSILEVGIDRKMQRTKHRPMARGALDQTKATVVSLLLMGIGLGLFYILAGLASVGLASVAFFGYVLLYTLYLKRATWQNIVIGGLFGALPPVLAWQAVSAETHPLAWLLVLIIFVWTPPHFWVVALYRRSDYEQSGLPMLSVTHGESFTLNHIFLYSILLFIVSILPFAFGYAGALYFLFAMALSSVFVAQAYLLKVTRKKFMARKLFIYSIWYLFWLYIGLLLDVWLRVAG